MTDSLGTRCSVLLIALTALLSGCADQPQAQTRAQVVTVATDASASNPDADIQSPQQEVAIDSPAQDPIAEIPAQPQEFEDRLLEIGRDYESFVKIDPDALLWANVMCAPIRSGWGTSASSDLDTHGRKLYRIFVKMQTGPRTYVERDKPSPVGQVVVKEAWTPQNEKPKEKAALFVMFKLEAQTPGTDEGWVYGTLTPDGKTVTSAGRVASCMSCHLEAPHDRLFGPHVRANRVPVPSKSQ